MKLSRVMAAALLALASCSGDRPLEVQPGPPMGKESGTLGLLNFRQIRSYWAAATGLDANQTALDTSFSAVRNRLPGSNAPDGLAQPAVTAVFTLGSAYCLALVNKEAALKPEARKFFGSLSLTKAPEDSELAVAVDRLTDAFWRRSAEAGEKTELVTLGRTTFTLGIAKPNANVDTAGKEAWLALCSATGAAVDSMTL